MFSILTRTIVAALSWSMTVDEPQDEVEPMSRWASVDSLQIHYRTSEEVVPEGRPVVVLVHGLIVSSR